MSDIVMEAQCVADLDGRCAGECNPAPFIGEWCTECLLRNVAGKLTAEIERLRAALEEVAMYGDANAKQIARRALDGEA